MWIGFQSVNQAGRKWILPSKSRFARQQQWFCLLSRGLFMLLKILTSFVLKVFAGSCQGCLKEMWLYLQIPFWFIPPICPLCPQKFTHWKSLTLWRLVYSWYHPGRGKPGTVGTPRGNDQGERAVSDILADPERSWILMAQLNLLVSKSKKYRGKISVLF